MNPAAADLMFRVIDGVALECSEQDAKWGQQDHPDGTGLPGDIEAAGVARDITQNAARQGKVTWRMILTEEVREAYAETDPERLAEELTQVSATAAQWKKAILRRGGVDTMRVYVSGQITGLDRAEARAAFARDCLTLEAAGYATVNPFDIPSPTDCTCPTRRDGEHRWECCLAKDIRVLVGCDVIYMRHDWRNSQGAMLEHDTAKRLGLAVMYGAPAGTCCEKCEEEITAGQRYTTLPGVGLYTHFTCEPTSLQRLEDRVTDVEIAEAQAHDVNDDMDIKLWWKVLDANGGWDDPHILEAASIADRRVGSGRYPAARWCQAAIYAYADLSGDYLRGHYKVPARLFGRIDFGGTKGTIVGFDGDRLMVKLDDRSDVVPLHPTYNVTYLETAEQPATVRRVRSS